MDENTSSSANPTATADANATSAPDASASGAVVHSQADAGTDVQGEGADAANPTTTAEGGQPTTDGAAPAAPTTPAAPANPAAVLSPVQMSAVLADIHRRIDARNSPQPPAPRAAPAGAAGQAAQAQAGAGGHGEASHPMLPPIPTVFSKQSIDKIRADYDGGQPGGIADAFAGVGEYVNQLHSKLATITDAVVELAQDHQQRSTSDRARREGEFDRDLKKVVGPEYADHFGIGKPSDHRTPAQNKAREVVHELGRTIFESAQHLGMEITPDQALAQAYAAMQAKLTPTKSAAVQAVQSSVKKLARGATIPPGTPGGSGAAPAGDTSRDARIKKLGQFYGE